MNTASSAGSSRAAFLVQGEILTTGIGEAPMPSQCHRCRRQPPQVPQFDLFGDQDLGPLWRQLPPAIRLAVTELMVRLLSESRRSVSQGTARERCDD